MIIEVSANVAADLELLDAFIQNMGNSDAHFRYFKSRETSVLSNHLITILLLENSQPIGYGHLDVEQEDVWLGVAITEGETGKGKGKIIIDYLIDSAKKQKVKKIKLAVDIDNIGAIGLYEKFGFHLYKSNKSILFFERAII